jgi:hypothetical protein
MTLTVRFADYFQILIAVQEANLDAITHPGGPFVPTGIFGFTLPP